MVGKARSLAKPAPCSSSHTRSNYSLPNLCKNAVTPLNLCATQVQPPRLQRFHSLNKPCHSQPSQCSRPRHPLNHHVSQTGIIHAWPTSRAQTNTHNQGSVVGPMKVSLKNRHPVHPQPRVVLPPIADPGCLALNAPV
jgi:hypothetical protein